MTKFNRISCEIYDLLKEFAKDKDDFFHIKLFNIYDELEDVIFDYAKKKDVCNWYHNNT
jgi:hypothetical protein